MTVARKNFSSKNFYNFKNETSLREFSFTKNSHSEFFVTSFVPQNLFDHFASQSDHGIKFATQTQSQSFADAKL